MNRMFILYGSMYWRWRMPIRKKNQKNIINDKKQITNDEKQQRSFFFVVVSKRIWKFFFLFRSVHIIIFRFGLNWFELSTMNQNQNQNQNEMKKHGNRK